MGNSFKKVGIRNLTNKLKKCLAQSRSNNFTRQFAVLSSINYLFGLLLAHVSNRVWHQSTFFKNFLFTLLLSNIKIKPRKQ